MKTAQRIATLETELSTFRMDVALLTAQIRGHETQLATLRQSVEVNDELASLPRTEAILAVLRSAEGTLSPYEILTGFLAAERDDDLRKVTATLDYLLKSRLVSRPSRGRYFAT